MMWPPFCSSSPSALPSSRACASPPTCPASARPERPRSHRPMLSCTMIRKPDPRMFMVSPVPSLLRHGHMARLAHDVPRRLGLHVVEKRPGAGGELVSVDESQADTERVGRRGRRRVVERHGLITVERDFSERHEADGAAKSLHRGVEVRIVFVAMRLRCYLRRREAAEVL